MSPPIPAGTRKFRTGFLPWFIYFLLVVIPGSLCLVVLIDGWHINHHALQMGAGTAVILSFLNACWLPFTFPAALTAEGVHGHSFWGMRRFIGWPEITRVRSFRLLNLRWVRLFAADGRVTWLALFQARRKEFFQEIQRLAPPESPLLKYLPTKYQTPPA